MGELQSKIEALGERLLELILNEPNPTAAMQAIAELAEQRGLVDSAPEIEPENPEQFVRDLWTDNPMLQGEMLPKKVHTTAMSETSPAYKIGNVLVAPTMRRSLSTWSPPTPYLPRAPRRETTSSSTIVAFPPANSRSDSIP